MSELDVQAGTELALAPSAAGDLFGLRDQIREMLTAGLTQVAEALRLLDTVAYKPPEQESFNPAYFKHSRPAIGIRLGIHGSQYEDMSAEANGRLAKCVDTIFWSAVALKVDAHHFLDPETVKVFNRGLRELTTPEFTPGNVSTTLGYWNQNRVAMFSKSVVTFYESCPQSFKTNGEAAIQERFILTPDAFDIIDTASFIQIGNIMRHMTGDRLVTYAHLGDLVSGRAEDAYIAVVKKKNGNLHCRFLQLDLVAQLNATLANHYGNRALPGRERNGRKHRARSRA